MSGLLVERTLGLAQLQDRGRFGVRHIGVTQGGALDWVAAGWANRLLGNKPDCAVLEIPMGGLILRCEQDTTLALTGADLAATLDDSPIAPWCSFVVRQGEQLALHAPRSGVRGYLAAPDGFAAPLILGSRATVVRENLGGLTGDGQPLRRGDRLAFGNRRPMTLAVPPGFITDYSTPALLSMLPGSRLADFAGRSLFKAFNRPWQVDYRTDRMGIRLAGPVLQYRGSGVISEGIPLGAIQVPPDGQPIVLMNDRQTIGGYPYLGSLTPLAVARLAQCNTGQQVRLHLVGTERARQVHIKAHKELSSIPLLPIGCE
ncbi:biotin-dependent carboxyltransferase family protein [Halopseudomonas sp.]|uniref:5-oxoprolinase subunit C family protein n=1 Tax=Halopseudomonas sp. TaxID=2901191 RepID=UPI0035677CE4